MRKCGKTFAGNNSNNSAFLLELFVGEMLSTLDCAALAYCRHLMPRCSMPPKRHSTSLPSALAMGNKPKLSAATNTMHYGKKGYLKVALKALDYRRYLSD